MGGQLRHIFETFDEDGDNELNFAEAQEFFLFYSDEQEELTLEKFESLTASFGSKFSLDALIKFYTATGELENLEEEYARFLKDWAPEVVECDDEEEFERIIKAYGL